MRAASAGGCGTNQITHHVGQAPPPQIRRALTGGPASGAPHAVEQLLHELEVSRGCQPGRGTGQEPFCQRHGRYVLPSRGIEAFARQPVPGGEPVGSVQAPGRHVGRRPPVPYVEQQRGGQTPHQCGEQQHLSRSAFTSQTRISTSRREAAVDDDHERERDDLIEQRDNARAETGPPVDDAPAAEAPGSATALRPADVRGPPWRLLDPRGVHDRRCTTAARRA
ncbi:hypothetical protein OG765_30590 [Streptomyces sp. NBC_00555]|nr:hypothetical protein [Streptomyces sp. NBC_00555]